MSDAPTLFEWAGGTVAIRRLIDAFYDRVERDDLLSILFPGGVSEEHRANVVLWWAEVFGGSSAYTEQLGGYPPHARPSPEPEDRARTAVSLRLDHESGR